MNKKIQILLVAALCIIGRIHSSQEELRLTTTAYHEQCQRLKLQHLNHCFNMQNPETKETITNSLFGQIIQFANNDFANRGGSVLLARILMDPEIPMAIKTKAKNLFKEEYYQSEIYPKSFSFIRIQLSIDDEKQKKKKLLLQRKSE